MATLPKGEEKTTNSPALPTGTTSKQTLPPGSNVTSNVPALPTTSGAKPPQFIPTPSSWKVDIKVIVDYLEKIKSEKGLVEANKVIAWLNSKRG